MYVGPLSTWYEVHDSKNRPFSTGPISLDFLILFGEKRQSEETGSYLRSVIKELPANSSESQDE